ncbi:MAG: hypothetical protein WBF18_00490, partial [Solirubrobacterales bacterium]
MAESLTAVFGPLGSQSLSDFADWAVDKPLRILLIVIGALIVTRISKRAIAGAVRTAGDDALR